MSVLRTEDGQLIHAIIVKDESTRNYTMFAILVVLFFDLVLGIITCVGVFDN